MPPEAEMEMARMVRLVKSMPLSLPSKALAISLVRAWSPSSVAVEPVRAEMVMSPAALREAPSSTLATTLE